MKIHNVVQGSAEWFKCRMGIPTASCFDQIITPKTGKLSASAPKYAYRLIAEQLLNAPTETIEGVAWMDRGKELEPQAVRQYEFVYEVQTTPVGFITTDDGLIGASPDRLVIGAAVGLEIKCPAPHTHIGYLLAGHDDKYRPQVQGQILVCEFDHADFYSFHPRMPPCRLRTDRDEPYIALMKDALTQFNADLFDMLARARSLGVFQAFEAAATPEELEHAEALRDELDPSLREA